MIRKWLFSLLIILVVLVVGITMLIFIIPGPKADSAAGPEWLVTVPIAHRGLHSGDAAVPENSLAAFQKAIEAGYAIELDVHLSADDVIVVFHDKELRRMTGVEGSITDLSLTELQQLRLLGSDQTIPTLDEVLMLIAGQVPLLIEIKNEGEVGALEQALIDRLDDYTGLYAVQAFNPFVLGYFKKHAPGIVRGQLSGSFKKENLAWYKKFMLRYLLLNGVSAPRFVAYEYDSMPQWMAARLQAKGLLRLAWTVDAPEQVANMNSRFDNIIFEKFRP